MAIWSVSPNHRMRTSGMVIAHTDDRRGSSAPPVRACERIARAQPPSPLAGEVRIRASARGFQVSGNDGSANCGVLCRAPTPTLSPLAERGRTLRL